MMLLARYSFYLKLHVGFNRTDIECFLACDASEMEVEHVQWNTSALLDALWMEHVHYALHCNLGVTHL